MGPHPNPENHGEAVLLSLRRKREIREEWWKGAGFLGLGRESFAEV